MELNYRNLRKAMKESENLREEFWSKPSSAITWSVQISMEQENRLDEKKLSPQFKRRIKKVKKKTLSALKILKSLVDAPRSTRIIRIHLPRLTMKYKDKRLEYARQY